MNNLRLQITIEVVFIAVALITGAIIVISAVFYYYNNAQNSIQSTNLYQITSVEFSPNLPIAPLNATYIGTATITIFSSTIPSFAYMVLMQNLDNTSIISSVTCPSYIRFTGFPTTSEVCIFLNQYTNILPEGGDQYILTYDNVHYNITAYNSANSTGGGVINFVYFNNNGKGTYEKLNPAQTITIST